MVLAPLIKKREHGTADRRAETAIENSYQAVKVRPNPCHWRTESPCAVDPTLFRALLH